MLVSATPSNLLTSCSRIPDVRVVKTSDNNADSGDGQQYDLTKLKKVELDRHGNYIDESKSEVKGRVLRLHHVKWTESHDLQIKQGIIVTIKMFDLWLCLHETAGKVRPWIGTLGIKGGGRNPNYHFRIQGNNGIVNVHAGEDFMWKLVVIPPTDPRRLEDCKVCFVHKDDFKSNKSIDEFTIEMEVGENAFHLTVDIHNQRRHLMLDQTNPTYPIVVFPKQHQPVRLAGFIDGEKYFTFCVGTKWNDQEYSNLRNCVDGAEAYNRVYIPLNHYYNTMNFDRRQGKKIRQDFDFQKLVLDVKETKLKDHVLAADYSYFLLLNDHLRQSKIVFKTLAEVLKNPAGALGCYTDQRAKVLNEFRHRLVELRRARGDNSAVTDFSPISKEIFDKVVYNYEETSAKEFGSLIENLDDDNDGEKKEETFLRKLLTCLYHFDEQQWEKHVASKIDNQKIADISGQNLRKLFREEKAEFLEWNETCKIVNDLVVHPKAENLDGKMKIVRVSSIINGNTLYTTLCLARQVMSNNNDCYTFEIIRDFGNFKLRDFQKKVDSELVQRNMVYRVRRVLQQEKCGHRDLHTLEPCTCKKYRPKEPNLECAKCGHEHTEITTYKDLNKLPCILILQKRGRLGDTFPRSFNCMDLRICYTNDIGNLSTVEQDLGRMCRYATRADGLEYDDLPYALIGKKLAELLGGKVINKKSAKGKKDEKKQGVMQKHSNFQGCFLEKGGNFLDHYCKESGLENVVDPKKPSFDCGNKEKHNNRILLEAEPQIGKTGVYLSVISKLRKLIEGDIIEEDEEFDDTDDDDDGTDGENETFSAKNDLDEEWQHPYHKNMNAGDLPKTTAEGKYCRIFGPYKYGEKPKRNVFSEDKMQQNKTVKRRSEISPYKSYSAEHNACPQCSITVGHQIVKVQVVGEESRLWIPNRERYRVVLDTLGFPNFGTCEADTLAELPTQKLEYKDNHLKSWIFTPTHGRAGTGNLNLTHSMVCPESKSFMSYVHVLVVRPGQFEEYCRIWGSSHVIMELPTLVQEWYHRHKENCTAEAGKIGYARRFIQAFAETYHLHTIFMLDDNIPYCCELNTCKNDDGKECIARDADNQVSQKRVPLYRVLKHLESIFDSDGEPPMDTFEAHKDYAGLLTRGSYTGPPDKYGVIGIKKHNRYNTTRVVNPFKNTHVFSLCLINVTALQSEGIKYKPWQAWEDLDLNNECDNKGLYVVKYNRFKMVKRHLSTWQREGFAWNEDTRLELGTNVAEEEVNILFRWIKCYARPGRWSLAWPTGETICPHVNDLVERVKKLYRAKYHFAAVHPDPKVLQNYLHNTPGLSQFENHVLILPVRACEAAKLTQLSAFRKEIVDQHFEALEGQEIRFKVVTSHNINEFQLWMILLYIEGKIKQPNLEHCENPFNLPIPVKETRENTNNVQPDHGTVEVDSDSVTPDSNTREPSHNEDEGSEPSLKLAPDSDVEDPSSPVITHFEEGNLVSNDIQRGDEESMDDEGTEENPIELSDSESEEESTVLDSEKDGHSESQAIPIDHSPGNADETQRMGDEDESQKTTGSSDDSESVPYDLKPSQSPRAILSSVPNIGDQNIETDEDRESPSLLGPSQTWAETADDRQSPSLLQPQPSQTLVSTSQSIPDDVLNISVDKFEKKYGKNYFETIPAKEKRRIKNKPSTESKRPFSDEKHDSPIITGSSALPHSKQGSFKEAPRADETNLKSLPDFEHPTGMSKKSPIGSKNSGFSGSHGAKNYSEATNAKSYLIPREGSLTDEELLRSVEQFEAEEQKRVDHKEDVNLSVQEVNSNKKNAGVDGRRLSPAADIANKNKVDETSLLILDDLEVYCSRTGTTKPLRPGYRVRKDAERVQVKSGSSHKIISKGEIRGILDKYDVKESD